MATLSEGLEADWRLLQSLQPAMPRPWSSKKEFSTLSGKLSATERHDFEAAVLPLLRVIWPEAIPTPAGRSFDRSGVDHLVWGDGDELPLVVQCKGYDAQTRKLGRDQLRQALKSISSFATSGLTAARYILVHNRDARDEEFRLRIGEALAELAASGKVSTAELFDRQTLLRRAFDAVYDRLVLALTQHNLSLVQLELERQYPAFSPVEEVPLRQCLLVADQHYLRQTVPVGTELADPAVRLDSSDTRLNLLIGEFGFGKTTAVLRSIQNRTGTVLYVPASSIPEEINGSKEFLLLCIDRHALFEPFSDDDLPTLELVARPVFEYLLMTTDLPLILVLDGLDESAFLSRRGGLQHIFNVLRLVRIPVLLTMRSEFWSSRQEEFETSVGLTARHGERRHQRINLIELLPWTTAQVGLLVRRCLSSERDSARAERLHLLSNLVGTDEFDAIYGDIPRRPLFLRQIVDSVAEFGLPGERVSRTVLMTRWIRLKSYRDIIEPRRDGAPGRSPVVSADESAETAVEVAWEAMVEAAGLMTQFDSRRLELTPSCSINDLLERTRTLRRIVEPTGLILHSLLQPASVQSGSSPRQVRFAHRTFQEFFLAHYILKNQGSFSEPELPDTVKEWVAEIAQETRTRTHTPH